MKYLNQFHKEAVERKLRKIAESMKSPMNSLDAANYMKRNFEMAKSMWIEIETYMAAIGFTKLSNDGRFSNGEYEAWDLVPRNVLKDKEGDIFIIDAEIKLLQR